MQQGVADQPQGSEVPEGALAGEAEAEVTIPPPGSPVTEEERQRLRAAAHLQSSAHLQCQAHLRATGQEQALVPAAAEEERQGLVSNLGAAEEQAAQPIIPPGFKAPPPHLCPPQSTPEEVIQQQAELERERSEAEEKLARKEKADKAHYAAITEVVYQRMSDERKAEINRTYRRDLDVEARSAAIDSFRGQLLSHDESEADSLEEFIARVKANDDFPVSAALLESVRASGEEAQRL